LEIEGRMFEIRSQWRQEGGIKGAGVGLGVDLLGLEQEKLPPLSLEGKAEVRISEWSGCSSQRTCPSNFLVEVGGKDF
jgi:hypothetical protein